MGHKRKNPTPSPLRMLSIFDARKRGMGLPEIAERTGHSISSIMRWTEKHGDEVAFFDLLIQRFPNLHDKIGFDEHYPKGGTPPVDSETDPETEQEPVGDDDADYDHDPYEGETNCGLASPQPDLKKSRDQ